MLKWNVYYLDFNIHRIKTYDIFQHSRFFEDCKKAARKYKHNKELFLKDVDTSLMYYFWGKSEWEIIISGFSAFENDSEIKIDVYEQVKLNWDVFCDYIWSHVTELSKKDKKEK